MSLDAVINFGKVQVSIGYDASATSIVLGSGEGAKLPQPSTDGDFNLVWWNNTDYTDPTDDPNVEIVRCTARSTDTLTVTRAQESTSATTKNASGKTYKMELALTKKMITDINQDLATLEQCYYSDTGAANAYVITTGLSLSALSTGMAFRFKAANSNTTTSTLNVDSIGVKTIKGKGDAVLVANDIEQNDVVEVIYDGTDFRMTTARKETSTSASQAQMEAASDNTVYATPLNVKWHPGVCKGWVKFTATGTPTIDGSHNVSSITDTATGRFAVNWNTNFSSNDYAIAGIAQADDASASTRIVLSIEADNITDNMSGGLVNITTIGGGGSLIDPRTCCLVGFGDQ